MPLHHRPDQRRLCIRDFIVDFLDFFHDVFDGIDTLRVDEDVEEVGRVLQQRLRLADVVEDLSLLLGVDDRVCEEVEHLFGRCDSLWRLNG
ncbi:hypothetical protein QYF36_009955 [Acer negundo]|nr:hypothetical protein QYF36_009955 [Acer negundo]